MVDPRKLHEIWNEQCEAARTIRDRYGLAAAFDYLVEEKLLNFAEAASEHRAFAQELPQFVSEVRRMFAAEEIAAQLKRITPCPAKGKARRSTGRAAGAWFSSARAMVGKSAY